MDEIIDIAKIMRPRSQARLFSGTVKEILGTCLSVGCLVEGESPRDIIVKIDNGDISIPDLE